MKKKKKVSTCWFQIEFAEISVTRRKLRPSFRGNTSHQQGRNSPCKHRKIRFLNFIQSCKIFPSISSQKIKDCFTLFSKGGGKHSCSVTINLLNKVFKNQSSQWYWEGTGYAMHYLKDSILNTKNLMKCSIVWIWQYMVYIGYSRAMPAVKSSTHSQ